MKSKFDQYEKDILESYESGEWVDVPNIKRKYCAMKIMQNLHLKKTKGLIYEYHNEIWN